MASSTSLYAQKSASPEFEYREYTIKKGDTLWGISERELKDNFQWPLIWKANPGVKNPDRIYPGEKIKIPASALKQKEVAPVLTPEESQAQPPARPKAPEIEKITPVREEYVFSRSDILRAPFIVKEVPEAGVITAPVGQRELITNQDDVYISTKRPANAGEKFLIVSAGRIKHPVTGQELGFLVQPLGVLQVTELKNGLVRSTVIAAYHRIARGNVLLNYVEPESPATNEVRKPDVNGYVIAIQHERLLAAQSDLIFIDKGRDAGLRPGDILATIKGPDRNAVIQLIRVENSSSTAVILKSNTQVNPGDAVTGLKEE